MEAEFHTYRIEVRMPRVVPTRDRPTTWRTLVSPCPYAEAMDAGRYLRDTLLLSGMDPVAVDEFFKENVRCIEYKTHTERLRELPLTGL